MYSYPVFILYNVSQAPRETEQQRKASLLLQKKPPVQVYCILFNLDDQSPPGQWNEKIIFVYVVQEGDLLIILWQIEAEAENMRYNIRRVSPKMEMDKINEVMKLKNQILTVRKNLQDVIIPDESVDLKTRRDSLLTWVSSLMKIAEGLLKVVDRVENFCNTFKTVLAGRKLLDVPK